jgi:hypothetical protein
MLNIIFSLLLTFSMNAFSKGHHRPRKLVGTLARVDQMANLPGPLQIIDYRRLAFDFDRIVYDSKQRGDFWPLTWVDTNHNNFPQDIIGIYTTIGDIRQGQHNGAAFHEALTSMGGILSATLVGIDKSKQDHNYVSMLKNYFNRDTGWNIMQNNTSPAAGANGGGYGRDWWYDVYPNLLFWAIYEKYPTEDGFDVMARSIADKFYEADKILKGNYQFSFFDYGKMTPETNSICAQPDVAAGHAYVMYAAYKKFGDKKYLEGAKSAMKALASNKINPSYEVLMPFGALMAARLNAEEGSNIDTRLMLDWTFDGTAVCRQGWGVLADRWNGFDVSGLMGSTVDHGGYGFVMNTYDLAWPLVPLVRYDQTHAASIGKWMLNAANAVRFAYPKYAGVEHQTVPQLAGLTKDVIAYEGIIKKTSHPEYRRSTRAPVAQGDGPLWIKGNPESTQFSVYGSAHVGIFGSIIQETNVEGILKLDTLATDFYRGKAYPTFLYFNPHETEKSIDMNFADEVDLYDLVRGEFVTRNAKGEISVKLESLKAMVLVEVPSKGRVTVDGTKMSVNGVVVDYHYLTKI